MVMDYMENKVVLKIKKIAMPIDLTVFKMSSPKRSTDRFSMLTKKIPYSFIK